jgi:predicted amidophosphoribosyltransferase
MNATILQTGEIRGSGGSRRVVGLERHYSCSSCGEGHRSWSRVRSCPGCGAPLTSARIRRAALGQL